MPDRTSAGHGEEQPAKGAPDNMGVKTHSHFTLVQTQGGRTGTVIQPESGNFASSQM
jgi:hypothetical protein